MAATQMVSADDFYRRCVAALAERSAVLSRADFEAAVIAGRQLPAPTVYVNGRPRWQRPIVEQAIARLRESGLLPIGHYCFGRTKAFKL